MTPKQLHTLSISPGSEPIVRLRALRTWSDRAQPPARRTVRRGYQWQSLREMCVWERNARGDESEETAYACARN
jgi:hypothetical protein